MSDKWHYRYLDVATTVADWSKDPSTKVGAVIVNPMNKAIVSTGINGFPAGHSDLPEFYNDREYKYEHIDHAEVNAINLLPYRPKNFLLYTTFHPCEDCIRFMSERGISRVYCKAFDPEERPDWVGRITKSREVAKLLGVTITEIGNERKRNVGRDTTAIETT